MTRIVTLLAVLAFAWPTRGDASQRFAGGIRAGYGDSEHRGTFRQLEAAIRYEHAPFWSNGGLSSRFGVDFLAGRIWDDADDAVLLGVGPGLALGAWRERLLADMGLSLAFLSDHTFGRVSLGVPIQFITHWRLRIEVLPGVWTGYRYQHMSNGNLTPENPGLNLQMVELTVRL